MASLGYFSGCRLLQPVVSLLLLDMQGAPIFFLLFFASTNPASRTFFAYLIVHYVVCFQLTYFGVELLSCGLGFTHLYLPGLPRTAMHNAAVCFRWFFQTGWPAGHPRPWPALGFVRCLNVAHLMSVKHNYGFNLPSPGYW